MVGKRTPEGWQEFRGQQRAAARRGIPFLFSFEEWWAWWQVDNRWARRGVRKDCLVMARKGDRGPYSPENVTCKTQHENRQESAELLRADPIFRARMSAKMYREHADGTRTCWHLRDRASHPKRKAVEAPDGRTWPSAALAAEELGLTRNGVAVRCRTSWQGWRWA